MIFYYAVSGDYESYLVLSCSNGIVKSNAFNNFCESNCDFYNVQKSESKDLFTNTEYCCDIKYFSNEEIHVPLLRELLD